MFYRKHPRHITSTGDVLVTKQSFKQECDIQSILKQYQKTGVITHVQNSRPTYADLPSNLDYQQSMNTLIIAREAFAGLPAKIRDHYGNDPERFLGAFYDPEQADYLREVGLLRPQEAADALPDPVRPPVPENT